MGGKTWSEEEERYFWTVIVPSSQKRVGVDKGRKGDSWENLAEKMKHHMGERARRRYTSSMLFEHFFQNIESQRPSPNAHKFVRRYRSRANLSGVSDTGSRTPAGRRRRYMNRGVKPFPTAVDSAPITHSRAKKRSTQPALQPPPTPPAPPAPPAPPRPVQVFEGFPPVGHWSPLQAFQPSAPLPAHQPVEGGRYLPPIHFLEDNRLPPIREPVVERQGDPHPLQYEYRDPTALYDGLITANERRIDDASRAYAQIAYAGHRDNYNSYGSDHHFNDHDSGYGGNGSVYAANDMDHQLPPTDDGMEDEEEELMVRPY